MLSRLRRLHPVRLARPMARRPGRIALVSALICLLAGAGFARFATDAGPDLLVGQSSQAKQVYDRFSADFGADPIVIVLAAQNPTALYFEQNLLRLGALESDIALDSRVATVLGPGTIAGSAQHAAAGEITRVRDEYPYFVAETALASAVQNGQRDPNTLSSVESNAFQAAQVAMAADVVKATQDADAARAEYDQHLDQHQSDPVLRGAEQAAEQAASKTAPPPLFSQYIAGPTGKTDDAAAQQLFDRLTAGFGDCSGDIASVLKITPTCQVFLWRLLLDLPNCPPATSKQFCQPKPQWAAILPKRSGDYSYAVITVRLKPDVVGHADQVNGLVQKIRTELQHGRPNDPNSVVKGLGPFDPTECASLTQTTNQQPSACEQRYHDAPLGYTIAGAPLLVQGVATTMTHLLLALFPVAFLVMLLLLLGTFRARGRFWPLVAAAGATLLTVGGALLIGVPISPAVLAGVPVLVGLGVDYAVQLLARFNEERDRGLGLEAALRMTLANTGPATLVAGTATLAGVAALAIITGIDLGPLAAVPLVASFALVLCAGVVFSWLAAVFVALPAAVWRERRLERSGRVARAAAVVVDEAPRPAERTAALATRWRAVLIPVMVLAVLGWVLMPRVSIETGVEKLLAPSLTELTDIDQVRAELGYDNEVDFALQGDLVGTTPSTAVPDSVAWMREAGLAAICGHPAQVALEETIGDFFAATRDSAAQSCKSLTQPSQPAPSPSPGASPSAAPSGTAAPASPSASPTPSAQGSRTDGDVVRVGNAVAQAASPSPAASPTPAASATPAPSGSAPATPAPTPNVSSPSASGTLQSAFVCSLRLLPALARNLVGPIPVDTQPCPVRDLYRNVFLGQDPSPISPREGRIALGVTLTAVQSDAKLINQLLGEMNSSPDKPKGVTVQATGLTALAAQAYDNLSSRILLFNLVPLAVVALVLLAIFRDVRRAFLPVLPAAVAAGWSTLVILGLGRLPGGAGATLGTLNPLTVVLGALVIALGTEFGVVLLQRFYEERARGLAPDDAAGAALHGVGRAIGVSAVTLGAGFAVLAVSGPLPGGMPLIADFGLAVLIDLGLAVGAVFLVMLPLAVALERSSPAPVRAPAGGFQRRDELPRERSEGELSNRAAKRLRDAERAEAGRRAAVEEGEADVAEPELERQPWGRRGSGRRVEDAVAPEAPPDESSTADEVEASAQDAAAPPPAAVEPPASSRRSAGGGPAGRAATEPASGAPEEPETRRAGVPRGADEDAAASRAAAEVASETGRRAALQGADTGADTPSPVGPDASAGSGRAAAGQAAATPRAAGAEERSAGRPGHLPGVSGRRRTSVPAAAKAPDAEPESPQAPTPHRIPGVSGRRRVSASTPPAAPPREAPAETSSEPRPRRMPGGVVRRAPASAPPPPAAPQPEAPRPQPPPTPEPPRARLQRPPTSGTPRPGTPRPPQPEDAAPPQPSDAPRPRRRRPPPWVRRNQPPHGEGE